MIETRKVLDLRINLKPSYLIVPKTGFHQGKSDLLILNFGTFQVCIYIYIFMTLSSLSLLGGLVLREG